MGFTIICNECGNKQIKNGANELKLEGINVGVTEVSDILGSAVESIDIECWNCDNEVNI